ncbi:MAG: bifunctional 4-hydroxy-2-oxoglutarate aldolase/2-dehydro-3-deoxy-phosphogluconate aldolase [Planctomycetota bacterium]
MLELERLTGRGLIPVVVIDDVAQAVPLGEALVEAGLPVAEVTLRTPAALGAIERMAAVENLLVGAGTVLNADQAKRAIDAGARFVISPGLDEAVVQCCHDRDIPAAPGIATATEAQRAVGLGLELVKFFPAEAIGGAALLKALAAPFAGLRFIPTGGVSASNLTDYLSLPSVAACGGSWMVRREWLRDGQWDRVKESVRDAVAIASETLAAK